MFFSNNNNQLQQTTSYKVVLPFYSYAAVSFVIATFLLLLNTNIIQQHYFHPATLAITHIMALGWATMLILGASYQLLPVIIEGKLNSNLLAYCSFIFCALGIPFLVYGFYYFQMNWIMQTGAMLINIGIICYLVNVLGSICDNKKSNIQAWYMAIAACWLFTTTFFGLLLVLNFSRPLLPKNSIEYLSLHAHIGLIGWFLLLVIGVGSRLIPMFLISKYTNTKILKIILVLINAGLVSFILIKCFLNNKITYSIPIICLATAIILFMYYCYHAYKTRIRKKIDEQMKTSLTSVVQLSIPILLITSILFVLPAHSTNNFVLLYGFSFFYGWITAIILGMTFKTLPFIVWNKIYHNTIQNSKTLAPKDLFSKRIYYTMFVLYFNSYLLILMGISIRNIFIVKIGAIAMLATAILYLCNVGIILFHKAQKNECN